MELLRQRQERLGEQGNRPGPDAHLSPLGAEYLAVHTYNVTDIIFFELLIGGLIHLVLTGIKLDAAVPVLEIAETDFAHAPLAHEPASYLHTPPLHGIKVLLNLPGSGVPVKAGDLERVFPLVLEHSQLFPPDLRLLTQILLGLGVVLLFSHLGTSQRSIFFSV